MTGVSFSAASAGEHDGKTEETVLGEKKGLQNKLVRLFAPAKRAVKDVKKGIEQAVEEKKLEAKKHFEDKVLEVT